MGAKILGSDTVKEGITGLRKLAALCEQHGLKLEPYGANSLMNAADLHVILSIRNCDLYGHIVPEEWHQHGLVDEIKPIFPRWNPVLS
jgi:L-alanine-DL-glutamate epimerase-like enolase superfamily enzyme